LTIIGHHYFKSWEPEKEEFIGTKKKTQNKKEKMIVDVNAILLVEKKKEKDKEQISCNHKQEDHRGISNLRRESW
jgi:hypothetical protein